jgi:hypothetical protein
MNLKTAKKITGGLSSPSKMPGYAYNLPAWECVTGVKLQAVEGSVCSGCYAMKGRYRFPNVKDALNRRLNSLTHPQWVEAMSFLISHYSKKVPFFRWHDSGDLQGADHLKKIFEVCKRTPAVSHWLPTREAKLLTLMDPDVIPKNLIIRMSSHMIDQAPVKFWPWTSTVEKPEAMRSSHVQDSRQCPAQNQGNVCGSCRSCWNKEVSNVAYPLH